MKEMIKKWIKRFPRLFGNGNIYPYLLLILPFALVILYTHGLHHQFKTFHYQDETLHYLVTVEFCRQFVAPPFGDYLSSVTPMYYLIMHAAGSLVSYSIIVMRWLTMLVSIAAVILFYRLMIEDARKPTTALLAALVFGLSPYVFGSSFILLNDNLALLFAVASILIHELNDRDSNLLFIASICCAAFTVLTRQNYIWIYVYLAVLEYESGRYRQRLLTKLVISSISLLPLVGLFVLWHGITPPSHQSHHVAHSLNLRAGVLLFVLTGFYGLFLTPRIQVRKFVAHLRSKHGSMLILLLGAASIITLLIVYPLSKGNYGSDGFLLSVLRYTPYVNGSSIFTFLLATMGVAVFVGIGSEKGLPRVLVIIFFGLTMLPSIMMFQKYYDYMVLLWLFHAMERDWQLPCIRLAMLIVGFTVYHIAYQFIQV